MASRLAATSQVPRARAVIAALPPGHPIVIEVNETAPIARRPITTADTAWVAEYRAAREALR